MTKRKRGVVILALAAALGAGYVATAREDRAPAAAAQQPAPAAAGRNVTGPFDAQTFRQIAQAEMPMVVNIRTESRRQTRSLTEFFGRDNPLERFFGMPGGPSQPREEITEGAGTGFILDSEGLILTNNHVVQGATKITVGLYAQEQEEYEATVVGRDPLTDSALIRLTEKPGGKLPSARLGNSKDVQPGDWVMAIGNPFNLAHTVTVGVISAVGRPFPVADGHWQDVLQTDAAINPGNSGGPLLNLRGEVVGINTAILAGGGAGGNVGVGFAIPIDAVRELLPELRRGTVTRGRIGVRISPVTKDLAGPLGLKEPQGALVRTAERGGPAAAAGIQPGDVIVGFNGKAVSKSEELVDLVTRTKPGTEVPVEVVRNGKRQTLQVTIAPLELEDMQPQGQGGGPADTGFGIALQNVTPEIRRQLELPVGRDGAVITDVEGGSAAARAGVQPGDVILEVNRSPVKSAAEAAAALRRVPEGDTGFLLVWRRGQEVFVTIRRQP